MVTLRIRGAQSNTPRQGMLANAPQGEDLETKKTPPESPTHQGGATGQWSRPGELAAKAMKEDKPSLKTGVAKRTNTQF